MLITQRHQLKCIARASSESKQVTTKIEKRAHMKPAPDSAQIDTVDMALAKDLAHLSLIASVNERKTVKREELLPKYLPMVDAYIAAGERYNNAVLVYCAIWCIDTDDLETALKLFEYAIAQQQALPEKFKRDLVTFAAESVAEWAERQYAENLSASPYIDEVCKKLFNNEWPTVNDIVRGKVFKISAMFTERDGDFKAALVLFERAQETNPKAGCKTRIDKLRKKLGL